MAIDLETKIIEKIADRNRDPKFLDLSWDTLNFYSGSGPKISFKEFPIKVLELTELENLFIARHEIIEIPDEIYKLKNLRCLDLKGNKISKIPTSIGRIENLQSLNLSANHLQTLPDEIGELGKLNALDFSFNELNSLPESFNKLHELEYLWLSTNKFNEIPSQIKNLNKLKRFGLGGNNISLIPEWLFNLQQLIELNLFGNSIELISNNVERLIRLNTLSLGSNKLKNTPDAIYKLPELQHLVFSNSEDYQNRNSITKISNRIIDAKKLVEIQLGGNPTTTPPPEVINKGVDSIISYFRQIEAEGQDYLYEAKLLILGEGGAGKTSLTKKITNQNYKLVEEKTTEGIDVAEWQFPMENGRKFRVNIWDFGGQEIYHATHQFFLTKRSVYILIADTRKEDTDFHYWLNVVELLSDNSPLLIIKNEKQDRRREINEKLLRGEFGNLREVLSVNLANNRGLSDALVKIKYYISNLKHIGSPLPKTWVKVRQKLENDTRNYISVEEFINICQGEGFTSLDDNLQFSEYLHDLGVILHFQDDPILRKTVILKPKWGTDAVYKVLDNKGVIKNLGVFNKLDLKVIWNIVEYANMQDDLLQLMIKFRLCYKIPNTDYYIAPQLLADNQPAYNWDKDENLLIRYTYEFMPKGIITQFIVSVHHLVGQQNLVWKSGVVLQKESALAEVIEFYGKREIRIKVSGKRKKELLTIITYELDSINSTYKKLKFSKLIPCNCKECKNTNEPQFYRFDILNKFYEDKQDHIQCSRSYEMVNVFSLIDDFSSNKETLATQDAVQSRSGSIVFQAPVERVFLQQLENGGLSMSDKQINISDNASFQGNIFIDSRIENSFNTIASSSVSNEVKQILKDLVQAVNKMCKSLPKDETEEVVRDLETLTTEAISKKPREKWYQLSADGLKDAAEKLGGIGKPVIDLAIKLVALLMMTSK